MAEIIKTWPSGISAKVTAEIVRTNTRGALYFTLGRGKPRLHPSWLWFTYRGRILGRFKVVGVVQNDGTNIPRLYRLDGEPSDWQIKPDRWVAICSPQCDRLKERLFMGGFRGWRYFDLAAYRLTTESRMRFT
jgi:hypothetical protein